MPNEAIQRRPLPLMGVRMNRMAMTAKPIGMTSATTHLGNSPTVSVGSNPVRANESEAAASAVQTATETRDVPVVTTRRTGSDSRSTPTLIERWLFSRVVIIAPAKEIHNTR